MKEPCVYIVASGRNGTLYTGVTSDLSRERAFQHREGRMKGFSARYGCKMLVWYEAARGDDRGDRAREADQGRQPREEALR